MVSVLIISHNRHQYLKRVIDYWSQSPWQIYIADDSPEPIDISIPSNIKYLHCPGVSLIERIRNMNKLVKSQYTMLSADDDFQAFHGIETCIEFLDEHPDYVSAQGYFTRFANNDKISNVVDYVYAKGYHFDGDNPKIRFEQAMTPLFMHQIYSIIRTRVFQKTVETIKEVDWRATGALELSFTLIPLIFGKYITMPVFYSARDGSNTGKQSTKFISFEKWYSEKKHSKEVNLWRNKVAQVYQDAVGGTDQESLDVFDAAISKYLMNYKNKSKLNPNEVSWRILLKEMLPKFILKHLQNLMNKYRMNQERKYHSVGYPWANKRAAEDWERIEKILLKHGLV